MNEFQFVPPDYCLLTRVLSVSWRLNIIPNAWQRHGVYSVVSPQQILSLFLSFEFIHCHSKFMSFPFSRAVVRSFWDMRTKIYDSNITLTELSLFSLFLLISYFFVCDILWHLCYISDRSNQSIIHLTFNLVQGKTPLRCCCMKLLWLEQHQNEYEILDWRS